MKHPTKLGNYKDTQTAARDFTNMKYDAVEEHYELISQFFQLDALKDHDAGKLQVSSLLEKLSRQNIECQKIAEQLWKKCKKYMPEE